MVGVLEEFGIDLVGVGAGACGIGGVGVDLGGFGTGACGIGSVGSRSRRRI